MEPYVLRQRQSLPLNAKIILAKRRIKEFYDYFDGKVYVAFSGGKDSTVLLHLVRTLYPKAPAVFIDTGLEYPEVRDFVKTIPDITWIKPKISFKEVITKYGYPVISKEQAHYISQVQRGTTEYMNKKRRGQLTNNSRQSGMVSKKWQYLMDQTDIKISDKCCHFFRVKPKKEYETTTKRHAYVGIMASESRIRMQQIQQYGCNAFTLKRPQSRPLAVWRDDDIWNYIKQHNLPYCKLYDMGYKRTGCMFCLFGVQNEPSNLFFKNKFQRMKETHPKQYNYCMNKLQLKKVLQLIKVPYE